MGPALEASLNRVRRLMERPRPDAAGVAESVVPVLEVLDRWVGRVSGSRATSPDRVRDLMRAFATDAARRADGMDWDEATQFYLALASLHQGLGELCEPAPGGVTAELVAIRDRLKQAFPPGYNSPRRFNPRAEPSLGDQFRDIRRQLGN